MATIQRDDNHVPIQGLHSLIAKKAVTYTAGALGAIGSHVMFTVTGDVVVTAFGVCNTTLTSGGAATLELGVTGNTAALVAQTTATTLNDGDVWVDAVDRIGAGMIPTSRIINDGTSITATVGTATITAGQIDFYCFWTALEKGASVVAV